MITKAAPKPQLDAFGDDDEFEPREEDLRDEILARYNTSHAALLDLLRRHLAWISNDGRPVSADDARTFMRAHPEIPWPPNNNFLGALFKSKGWAHVGFRPSQTKGRHASVVRVWTWKGA